MTDSPIRIVRTGDVFVRGVLYPFRNSYRIENSGEFREVPGRGLFEINYEGTPIKRLREIAARLGREQGRQVVDETKSKPLFPPTSRGGGNPARRR